MASIPLRGSRWMATMEAGLMQGQERAALPIGLQAVGFVEWQGTIPAQERVLAADGLPDQQAVEGIAVPWRVRKAMKG
jgi:hypothetical protein